MAKLMKKKKLTDKQARFVQEYLKDSNGTQAAIRAGYSKNGANQAAVLLLANIVVRAAVDAANREVAERNAVTVDEVVATARLIRDVCVRKTKNRRLVDATAAVRANEQLGRIVAAFTDKTEISGSIELAGLSDEQIDAQIARRLSALGVKK